MATSDAVRATGELQQLADEKRDARLTPGIWGIDPAHTLVGFTVRHMSIAPVSGRFTGVSGQVIVPDEDPLAATVTATIEVATVSTGHPMRDDLIRSPDFLDAAAYPAITFGSQPAAARGDETWELPGDLTIKGTTRPVVLLLSFGGVVSHRGATRAGFTASTEISRKDFGVTWNGRLDTGGAIVSDTVRITIAAEIVLARRDD